MRSSFLCDVDSLAGGGIPGVFAGCQVWNPTTLTYSLSEPCFHSHVSCAPYSSAFDWDKARQGFSDSQDVFFLIFACFLVVKILNMARR